MHNIELEILVSKKLKVMRFLHVLTINSNSSSELYTRLRNTYFVLFNKNIYANEQNNIISVIVLNRNINENR